MERLSTLRQFEISKELVFAFIEYIVYLLIVRLF